MCYTININTNRDAIEKRFDVDASALQDFKFFYFYNAFQNPQIPVITQNEPNKIQLMEWGLIPSWAKNSEHAKQIKKGTYNARSETLTEKASYKNSIHNRRCLIIAAGFFEWQQVAKEKVPWYIHLKNQKIFAITGIYDTWTDPLSQQEKKTISMITTKANPLMERIHNTKKRMPVILTPDKEIQWKANTNFNENIQSLLSPIDEAQLNAYTVSKGISKKMYASNDPSILKKIDYFSNQKLF